MDTQSIKAHLNLSAVLQNLEDLVKLDPQMTDLTKNWSIVIQFAVWNGPAAYLVFSGGTCKHGVGNHANPTVKLLFTSPAHLNRMFDGKGNPIPVKGFAKLGFMQREFPKLTDRLEYYLKPEAGKVQDDTFARVNTTLSLYTAIYAVKELATLEPTCKKVAAATPPGVLQVEVLPDGPQVHLMFDSGSVRVAKGPAAAPTAKMMFKDMSVASALLSGKLDAFQAVTAGDVILCGMLPIIDNVGLILDRVEAYLR